MTRVSSTNFNEIAGLASIVLHIYVTIYTCSSNEPTRSDFVSWYNDSSAILLCVCLCVDKNLLPLCLWIEFYLYQLREIKKILVFKIRNLWQLNVYISHAMIFCVFAWCWPWMIKRKKYYIIQLKKSKRKNINIKTTKFATEILTTKFAFNP